MQPTLVIMAAGIGSRYGGLKQIEPVGPAGEIMLDYSVFDASREGFTKFVFIIRHDLEKDFKTIVSSHFARQLRVEYVFQELTDLPADFSVPNDREKPWGTAHAILCCRDMVHDPFAVINADDFYGRQAYHVLGNYLRQLSPHDTNYAMVGFRLRNTLSNHGHVTRGICEVDSRGTLAKVTERFKVEKTAGGARYADEKGQWIDLKGDEIASMNMFGFAPGIFAFLEQKFPAFLTGAMDNLKAEFLIPAIVDTLIQEQRITMQVLETPEKWFGVTYKKDRAEVTANIRKLITDGVYPERLWD